MTVLLGLLVTLAAPGIGRDYLYGLLFTEGLYIPNPVRKVSLQSTQEEIQTFRILNLRPKPLSIQVEPACECLEASWQQAVIRPFSWQTITVTIQPGKERRATEQVAFRTDSSQKPFLFAFIVIEGITRSPLHARESYP